VCREFTKWYEECIDSLFHGQKDNWVYEKIKELTALYEEQSKEDVIKDACYRFKVCLEYAVDVFIGDRMGSKSYQLPFSLYFVMQRTFPDAVAAVATEALMTVVNWDYRVRSNLLKLILYDDNPELLFLEKMTIFFMALEEGKRLEDAYMSDCKQMTLAEFYPRVIEEVSCQNYEYVKGILQRIRTSRKPYFLVFNHVLWKVNEWAIPLHLRELYAKSEKIMSRYSDEGMEQELIDFIKMDMYEYITKDCADSYNPFWLYGTKKYRWCTELIQSRKHIVEQETIWVKYLDVKATAEGKETEYISSFHDVPPEGKLIFFTKTKGDTV